MAELDDQSVQAAGDAVIEALRVARDLPPQRDEEAPAAEPATPEPDEFEQARQAAAPDEEDRSDWITVGGHQYRNMDEVVKALENAQQLISRGDHKQAEPDDEDEDWYDEDEDQQPEPVMPIWGPGRPLSGEPQNEAELIEWANVDIAEATKFALAQPPGRIRPDLVNQMWNAWAQTDHAGATSYSLQWQGAQQDQKQREFLDQLGEMLLPVIQTHRANQAAQALAGASAAPGFDQYRDQVWQEIQNASAEYHQWFETLNQDEAVQELLGIYAAIRGKEWLAHQMGGNGGSGVTGQPGNTGQPPPVQPPLPSKAGAITTTTSSAAEGRRLGASPSKTQDQIDNELFLYNLAREAQGQPPVDELPDYRIVLGQESGS